MSEIEFASNRPLDVICLGRAGVDLYAREANTDMNEVSGFNKFVEALRLILLQRLPVKAVIRG